MWYGEIGSIAHRTEVADDPREERDEEGQSKEVLE